MNVSDEQLRAAVRAAIAKRVPLGVNAPAQMREPDFRHASHVLVRVAPGSDGDGSCLIEPAVACNHCGYCQSYGH